jgi:hypothetical protein
MKIYKPYDPYKVYIAGTHVAEGSLESATLVVDWDTLEDVAWITSSAGPVQFFHQCLPLLQQYHFPLWSVELTPLGGSLTNMVLEWKYPNIYWHFLDDFGWMALRLVQFLGFGFHLFVGKIPGHLLNHFLFFAQFKIHSPLLSAL